MDYLSINKAAWNAKVPIHLDSNFYGMDAFIAGKNPLKSIELDLLGNIEGKTLLHLQCHFGQDTLQFARMGAKVTGIDLSDKAIEAANVLAARLSLAARFICCDVYETPKFINEKFDVVFASYGTIGWLPDLKPWAKVVAQMLKTNGKFVFAEFHPTLWMLDESFKTFKYDYFNSGPIAETYTGTYADKNAPLQQGYVMWNHPLQDVLGALLAEGMQIDSFQEFDYSPYDCFNNLTERKPGEFVFGHFNLQFPMVYALVATKKITDASPKHCFGR